MRRTRAPSQISSNGQPCKGFVSFSGATRNTETLLSLLTSTEAENVSQPPPPEQEEPPKRCDSFKPGVKIFNVVWGKQTKKKHKTWEGDGIVELTESSAVLKDETGHILGRLTNLKNITVEEGSRLLIGSKEVEVRIKIIDAVTNKEKTAAVPKSECTFKRPIKRMKMSTSFNSPLLGKETSETTTNLLTMPKPDHSHQWKYNKDKLPVTDVKLDLFLSRVLRTHQQEGVLFLYACVTGMRNVTYNGAILADEMGLGKTLQCICLIWLLLKNGPYGGVPLVQRVLIVTPSSLANNWLKEFKRWLGSERLQPFVVNQKQKPSAYANIPSAKSPVMIISYEMLVRHFEDLKNINFGLLICDEGHRLKNNQIRVSILLSQLSIKRKIILTGTPIQNDLQEFYSLVDFVNPIILGEYAEFKKHFEDPIVASNQPNCDDETRQLGGERAKELGRRTQSFILRRTQSVINQYLPSKQDCVILCTPTPLQVRLYEAVVRFWEDSLEDAMKKVSHLSVITLLKKICNDSRLVRELAARDPGEQAADVLDSFEPIEDNLSHTLQQILEQYENGPCDECSSKMIMLKCFLSELSKLKEKVVLISYFTQTLDLLEKLCQEHNYTFLRLDGSTAASARMELVDKFNNSQLKYFVFLLSAKAGGVGLNLTGASRLVLFDLDWNPASDLQAMSRIWRDGQKRNVYIYRFLTAGTIEEKMYQRQISKTTLSNIIVDVQSSSNVRLSIEELKDLFVCKPECDSLTHELLSCDCDGTGVPTSILDDEDDTVQREEIRDCQLTINDVFADDSTKKKNNKKISELMEWEHYSGDIDDQLLHELCLKPASAQISFIFRNKTSTSPAET